MTASSDQFHLQFVALHNRAVAEQQRHGRERSNRHLAKVASRALRVEIRNQAIGTWLKGTPPRLASSDQVVAVVKALSEWANQNCDERYWRDLLEKAQHPRDRSNAAGMGMSMAQVKDPFQLGVRTPVTLSSAPSENDQQQLTAYVARQHDQDLRAVVTEAVRGRTRLAVLVGEVSTGKTRSLWEAVQALPPDWRLWHPIDSAELLECVDSIQPRTVIWLNDAHLYLDPRDGKKSELVAARLRRLLRQSGPLLVLGTLWSVYVQGLTRAATTSDLAPHPQVTELLTDSAAVLITVPPAFTDQQLRDVRAAARIDRRLRFAFKHAREGRVTQVVGGTPFLLQRCDQAPEGARAVIEAAFGLYHYGHGQDLPHSLLEAAASSYLGDDQWAMLPQDWFVEALTYTGEPVHGVPGPVTPYRRRQPGDAGTPSYRLAHVLQQLALHALDRDLPTTGFWDAVTAHGRTAADRAALAREAEIRGRYSHAAALYEAAAEAGHQEAWKSLVELLEILGHKEKATAVAHRSGDPEVVRELNDFRELIRTGFDWAANRFRGSEPPALTRLQEEIRHFEAQGAQDHALELARQGMRQGEPEGYEELLRLLESSGAHEQADNLAVHTFNLPYLLGDLLVMRMRTVHDVASLERLVRRAVDAGHSLALGHLIDLMRRTGRQNEGDAMQRFGLTAEGAPAAPW
ncbi:hypothetical protein [Streptomyces sp. NPDC059479]|uniref:hypothetical protein n=1 Tax=Streptomyces sp. NPDC059479 TaxID=3346848 RepID=UPI00367DE3E8